MEKPHCIMFDISTIIKQEFIPEEDDLSDERILENEEYLLQESQCEQRLDKCDSLLIKNAEVVSEESDIHPVIKEELIIENEDDREEHLPPYADAVVNEDVIQQEASYRTNESKQQRTGISEVNVFPKRYQCEICKKVYGHKSILNKHVLIHSGVKKHQCDVCNRAFTQKCTLTKHKLIHSGEKKYKCDVCKKAFAQKSSLSHHLLIHSGIKKYQCDVCNKAFTYSCNLSVHKLIHSGIRKYKCEVCEKAFTSLSNLSIHSFIHSGIKKYKCGVCGKSFTQMSTLSKHKLTHGIIKKTTEV